MDDLIWAGLPIDKLSRDQLVACALHFRDAHIASTLRQADMLRRMSKMELGLSKAQVAKLDQWLSEHPNSDPEIQF
jgi:hypothetical protein